ncbi:hypothetical protein FO519_009070 [Halicephalobus sp. NKZ332]|nr:hypothetical protein FO519_009070 [Halicephalobus sp. NKZ332]
MEKNTVRVFFICFTLSLACNFENGFSATYLNNPIDEFKRFLNESYSRRGEEFTEAKYDIIWNIICNIWFVGFFFGIFLSPIINDRFGRKVGFILMNALILLASISRLLSVLFYCPELLIAARVVASISLAVAYQSLILFLQECAPTRLRGAMSFTSEICIALMSLLGMFIGMDSIFGKNLKLLLGFAIGPSILALIVLFPMHETPKFLFIVKKQFKAASKSVKFYQGKKINVDSVLHEIALEAEQDSESNSSLKEIFTTPYLRKSVIVSCAALQVTVSLWSILLSSTRFLKDSGLEANTAGWASTAMAFTYFLGTSIGAFFVDRFGRRPMILTFLALNTLSLLLFVIFSVLQPQVYWFKYGCLGCFLFYGLSYGGVGPITWFIPTELVPQRHRSLVQSLCYAINTLIVIIWTFSVLPLFTAIKAYSFLGLYVIPNLICLVYLFFELPETKSREIHEIVSELKGKTGK